MAKTHGMFGTKAYGAWSSMLARCKYPYATAYHRYGGRGIKVCERWLKFENFYADMGPRPDRKTLDRVDNDGDYCPENCRWATRNEQTHNSSGPRLITFNGKTKNLSEWGRYLGIGEPTVIYRLKNWPIEKALGLKKQQYGTYKRHNSSQNKDTK